MNKYNSLEQSLIDANSDKEAVEIIDNLTNQEVREFYSYLKAGRLGVSLVEMRIKIMKVTYDYVVMSKTIRGYRS